VVDADDLARDERVEVCRLVLKATSQDRATFETDIPWSEAPRWPSDVRAAAEILSGLREPAQNENELYRQTGVVAATDARTWEAFLTFAPYAYDASVWDEGADELVALNDSAEAIVASLTADQADTVGRVIGHGRLVPVKDWRKRGRPKDTDAPR
jgi:hypothetical protein